MQELNVQAMEALARANKVRSARALDKKLIRTGKLQVPDLLRDLPPHWETAKVIDLLVAMPYVGRTKACRWLRTEGISPTLMFKHLPEVRRLRLARHADEVRSRKMRLKEQMIGSVA